MVSLVLSWSRFLSLTLVFLVLVFCLFSLFLIVVVLMFCFLILAWRKAKTSFGLGCALLDFCIFCVILPLISSGVMAGLPQNLVQTPLDFPWFLRFFWYGMAWFCLWWKAKTSLRLALTLLDFCLISCVAKGENLVQTRLDFAYFCAYLLWYCLTWCVAKGENLAQAWLDFAWFLCFFAIEKLDIAMVDGRGEDETSFGIGLVLLDFCYFFAIGTLDLVWGDGRGEDETSFWIGLILRDFCCFVVLVVLLLYCIVVWLIVFLS